MKLSLTLLLTLFSALALTAPSPSIEARGCSCHKVGDEYTIPSSPPRLPSLSPSILPLTLPRTAKKIETSADKNLKRSVCGGSTCPRDLALNAMDELVKRGCSCHRVGSEYVCGGSTCP
ncbi:uncharacterized protein RSE6_10894 [Rhynchosporium secalis]|uniref:Uncharacterized protein n=1 Tax=Rhynchosporium secalis TaxID=38038 RepID=A0A1E1MLK8_RHYSE|nr:uncharacterized protein RSE6_10894 [Rhynchosporium secalis]